MKNRIIKKTRSVIFLFFTVGSLCAQSPSNSPGSIGVRIGYDGATNGLSYYKQVGRMMGIECSLGYNDKEGRRLDVPMIQKGNTMFGLNLTPYFYPKDKHTTATVYASLGLGARFHHYRMNPQNNLTSRSGNSSLFTLDERIGLGLLITPFPLLEAFVELHVNHYNNYSDYGALGTESGAGIRLALSKPPKHSKPISPIAKAKFDKKENH